MSIYSSINIKTHLVKVVPPQVTTIFVAGGYGTYSLAYSYDAIIWNYILTSSSLLSYVFNIKYSSQQKL